MASGSVCDQVVAVAVKRIMSGWVLRYLKVSVVRLWRRFLYFAAASLHKTGNRRQLFSASSRPLVPLLTTYASLICGQDALPSDGKLCRPCHRRLERILRLKEDLKKSEEELIQLLRGAETSHMTRRERRGADSGDASPVAEAHTPQRHPAEISLAKRRNAVSTPLRHIHRHCTFTDICTVLLAGLLPC